jgi:MFS family permease
MKISTSLRKIRAAPEKWPFFYGWVVLAAGALGVLMSLPGQTIGISVFIDPLMEVVGTSRSAVSFTYMIGTLGAAMFLPFMGKLFDRRGAPFMAVLAGATLGFFLVYMAGIDVFAGLLTKIFSFFGESFGPLFALSLGFLFIRLWGQGVLTMTSRNMVMKWFDRRRGLANGILGFITTVGFSMAPRVFDDIIGLFSWRGAYIILAVIVGALFPVLAFLFYHDNPRDHGLVPDGAAHDDLLPASGGPSLHRPVPAHTLKEARGTPLFRYVTATLFISAIVDTAFTFHIVSIFEESGLSRSAAVRFFFPAYMVSIFSHFLGSWVSDYIESKYMSIVHLLGILLTCGAMLVLAPGFPLWTLIIGQGLCHGMNGISSTVLWPRYFGTKHLGAISGFAMTWMVVGSALGPFLFSLSLDLGGSYIPAALTGLGAAVVLLFQMIRSFRASHLLRETEA